MSVILYCDEGSPPCRAVLLAAAAMDVKLTIKTIDIRANEHMSPEFLKISPQHKLPTIDDNGFFLWESRAIMQYLANAYGKNDSVYPKDPKERALVDHRLYFDLQFLQHEFAINYYAAMFAKKPLVEENLAKLKVGLDLLEGFLRKTKYSAGNNLTLADFSIMTTLTSLDAVEFDFDLDRFPKIAIYYYVCQKEMKDYDVINSKGLTAFKELAKATLELTQE